MLRANCAPQPSALPKSKSKESPAIEIVADLRRSRVFLYSGSTLLTRQRYLQCSVATLPCLEPTIGNFPETCTERSAEFWKNSLRLPWSRMAQREISAPALPANNRAPQK